VNRHATASSSAGRTPAAAFVEGLPKPQQQKENNRPEKTPAKKQAA
jgi:hypothetical protein